LLRAANDGAVVIEAAPVARDVVDRRALVLAQQPSRPKGRR
jgi:hypothetical protein